MLEICALHKMIMDENGGWMQYPVDILSAMVDFAYSHDMIIRNIRCKMCNDSKKAKVKQ